MPRVRANVSNTSWYKQRELGQQMPLGHSDHFYKGLYSSFSPCHHWHHEEHIKNSTHGAIFNLEFSVDGSLLAAACEKNSILLFDPLNRKMINDICNAHNGCVNCVKFLDSRIFASCGDDSTVAIWDARNLKKKVRILHGHGNPVSNIEFSPRDSLLVTSGFDGNIFTWDSNHLTDSLCAYNRVFRADGLVRSKLAPDASKMIICTTEGYLMIIHNLNFESLAQDLCKFNPSTYRLMQLSQSVTALATSFTNLFSPQRKMNRVEFLSDFPRGDDIVIVSSLEIHPQGWCALTRNISNNDISEWSSVHDIQESEIDVGATQTESDESSEDSVDQSSDSGVQDSDSDSGTEFIPRKTLSRQLLAIPARFPRVYPHLERGTGISVAPTPSAPQPSFSGHFFCIPNTGRMGRPDGAGGSRERDVVEGAGRRTVSSTSNESGSPKTDVREQTARQVNEQRNEHEGSGGVGGGNAMLSADQVPITASANVTVSLYGSSQSAEFHGSPYPQFSTLNTLIHQNVPRLTHYVRELNVGEGFFKELCFSPDGRVICSPYGCGVRFLAFSPECSEYSLCFPKENAVPLHELCCCSSHTDPVISTRFSPHHCFLVSGCLGGNVLWHQPF